ncbi:hypothetical protein BN903_3 [Halorubrum sp. AJ67]|nr:hypothetical protein BN903_3 [Halorubrum sp. AJ67]
MDTVCRPSRSLASFVAIGMSELLKLYIERIKQILINYVGY